MSARRRTLVMCTINPVLIDGLAQLVGSQFEVMRRLGISWNTWTKIRASEPVTLSVGQRLRARIVGNPSSVELIVRRSSARRGGAFDREELERIFLLPADGRAASDRGAAPRARQAPAPLEQMGAL